MAEKFESQRLAIHIERGPLTLTKSGDLFEDLLSCWPSCIEGKIVFFPFKISPGLSPNSVSIKSKLRTTQETSLLTFLKTTELRTRGHPARHAAVVQ